MAGYYRARQGDTLSSIAYDFGFANYESIYHDPNNAGFRSIRPDPDLIFPNDLLYIPDKEQQYFARPTDATHRFRVRRPTHLVRIAVQDSDGKPLTETSYELWIGLDKYDGNTNGLGMLEQQIPIKEKQARLKIAGFEWSFRIGDLNPVDDTDDKGVTGIQMRLANLGFHPGPIDGIMGPLTRAAISEFQGKHPPLLVDGICGPRTCARLLQEHGC
jgi:N-acetylmuramoyl-L-alanine amidase